MPSCCHQANHQVSMDSSGSFKTARPVDGCFYEFQELSAGQLRITEVKDGHSANTDQLFNWDRGVISSGKP